MRDEMRFRIYLYTHRQSDAVAVLDRLLAETGHPLQNNTVALGLRSINVDQYPETVTNLLRFYPPQTRLASPVKTVADHLDNILLQYWQRRFHSALRCREST